MLPFTALAVIMVFTPLDLTWTSKAASSPRIRPSSFSSLPKDKKEKNPG